MEALGRLGYQQGRNLTTLLRSATEGNAELPGLAADADRERRLPSRDYLRALAQRSEVDAQETSHLGLEKRAAAHARRRFKCKTGAF